MAESIHCLFIAERLLPQCMSLIATSAFIQYWFMVYNCMPCLQVSCWKVLLNFRVVYTLLCCVNSRLPIVRVILSFDMRVQLLKCIMSRTMR